jgi:hypothetical protein
VAALLDLGRGQGVGQAGVGGVLEGGRPVRHPLAAQAEDAGLAGGHVGALGELAHDGDRVGAHRLLDPQAGELEDVGDRRGVVDAVEHAHQLAGVEAVLGGVAGRQRDLPGARREGHDAALRRAGIVEGAGFVDRLGAVTAGVDHRHPEPRVALRKGLQHFLLEVDRPLRAFGSSMAMPEGSR